MTWSVEVCHGGQGAARRVKFWSVGSRSGEAVGERPGLVGYGEVGFGDGMARFGVALLLTLEGELYVQEK